MTAKMLWGRQWDRDSPPHPPGSDGMWECQSLGISLYQLARDNLRRDRPQFVSPDYILERSTQTNGLEGDKQTQTPRLLPPPSSTTRSLWKLGDINGKNGVDYVSFTTSLYVLPISLSPRDFSLRKPMVWWKVTERLCGSGCGHHCIILHFTALHCTALQYTVLHCITLHCTALHCSVLHYPLPFYYTTSLP